jgi:hypothetical protein
MNADRRKFKKDMKKLLLTALLCIFTSSISAQEKLNEIDLRVNGIGSGSSYSTVIRKLGKPNRTKIIKFKAENACGNSDETHLTLFYSGLKVILLGDGKGRNLEVYSIEVTTNKWTVSGIKIGATEKRVQTRFGKSNSKDKKSGETIFYYVTKENLGGVNFYFRNNKLVRVEMTETLC